MERDVPLFRGVREPEVDGCPGGLEERPGIVAVVGERAVVVGVVPRVEINLEGEQVVAQGNEEEERLVRREDDEAIVAFCRQSADKITLRRSMSCWGGPWRGRNLSLLYIDGECAQDRFCRGAHFRVQREAPGMDEARTEEWIASDFDEIAILGEYPAVGGGVGSVNGENFEDIAGDDRECFVGGHAPVTAQELRRGDRGAKACDCENEDEKPAEATAGMHQLSKVGDEGHDRLGEENNDESNDRVYDPLLCLSYSVFIAEAEDEHDAADDDGDDCKETENVYGRGDDTGDGRR